MLAAVTSPDVTPKGEMLWKTLPAAPSGGRGPPRQAAVQAPAHILVIPIRDHREHEAQAREAGRRQGLQEAGPCVRRLDGMHDRMMPEPAPSRPHPEGVNSRVITRDG